MNDSKEQTDDLFCGLVLHGSEEGFKKIKQFILTETTAELIYQKKTVGYLKIEAEKTAASP